ncbi:MAG: hypothetical protein WCT28_04210 [Patescibacteria group bacterium]
MILRIFIGLFIMIMGWLMVWKTMWFEEMLGPVYWAEEHLGTTNFFYKLLGTAIIILGIVVTLDLFDMFLGSLVSSFF